ncbi:uncharacterized protein LOC129792593 [Lutzomyia longipalpis]|uniref:uncharacterized protein LOC129792593 n=1 Tax=Lutzomyia longipalpis TaxID=7200 RepID=UPI0024842507|nr:uncharacterized protein LOC129792593 [Lutzomyia longipalpis]
MSQKFEIEPVSGEIREYTCRALNGVNAIEVTRTGRDDFIHYYFGTYQDLAFTFPSDKESSKIFVEKHLVVSKGEAFKSFKRGAQNVITDVSLDTFKEMIQHIYGGPHVNIHEGNFLEILRASRKFSVHSLTYEVLLFLVDFLNGENLPKYFVEIDKFSIKMINDFMRHTCIVSPLVIIENLTISNPAYKRLLSIILEFPCLSCTEFELYNGIMSMLKKEFQRLKKPLIDEEFRNELGQMIYLIRFPAMSLEDLMECAKKPTLLTSQELIDIQMWVKERIFSQSLQFFSVAPRLTRLHPNLQKSYIKPHQEPQEC